MAKVIKLKDNTYLFGTIIESGSNSNGNYVKYSDGTLIQWGTTNISTSSTSFEIGGVTTYRSNQIQQKLPLNFINTSSMSVSAQIEGGAGVLNFIYTISGTSYITLTLQSTSSNYSRTIKWMIIGKWK